MIRQSFFTVGSALVLAAVTGCFAPFAAAPARAGVAKSEPAAEVVLYGRLVPRKTTGIAGATVVAYEILPDNRLLPVVEHVVQTEADGTYRARIRLDAAYRGPLLVRADCEFGYGMVLVSDTQVVGDGIAALPITDASTVQAQVYLTARQQHLWPLPLDAVLLHRFIGESLASAVLLEADHARVLDTLTKAVTSAAISFDQTIRDGSHGLSQQAYKGARTAMHGAFFTLADELYRAADTDAALAARATLDERMAAIENGPSGEPEPAWTIASQAALEAFLPYIDALGPQARAAAVQQLERDRAREVVNLVARTFVHGRADAGAVRQLADAGDQLAAAVSGLHGDGDAMSAAARQAWGTYQTTLGQVLPQLLDPGADVPLTSALNALDARAVAAVNQLRNLTAAADPAVTAAEARRQIGKVFVPTAQTPDAADNAANGRALTALGNVCLARLR